MSMSSEVYTTLEDNNVTWICCGCGLPNFASSLFSCRSTILSNSFSTLSSIDSEEELLSPIATSSPAHVTSRSRLNSGTHTGERRRKWSEKPTNCSLNRPKSSGQMKIMVINFQSVKNKVAELAICLDNHKPDILIGTESWLFEGISNSEIFPADYTVVKNKRQTSR